MDDRKLLGRNGFKYKPRFGVIVVCEDEKTQAKTFERLKKDGYKCKVVTV
ncbi:hypothetical protein I6M49_21675 [Shewanella algae]|nr:hypothetical protein [Shewanella algae]MBO2656057.1 hypothetical protein [Shewanella algae]